MRPLSLLLILFLCTPTYAQKAPQSGTFGFRADLLQHSVAMPGLKRAFTPFAPGLRLGVVRHGRTGRVSEWRQQALVGFYRHPRLQDAFMLGAEVAYRAKLGPAFLGFSGGPGYMLQLPHAPVYRYQDGRYVRALQALHRITVQLAAEVGWRFANGWEAHLRFEEMFEYPYGLNGSPVLPHRLLAAGLHLPLTTN